MSDSDNSDNELDNCDIDELIVNFLSSGPKEPDELLNLVLKKAKVAERTYYRHLEKLSKGNIIDKCGEKNDGSQLNIKYFLKNPKPDISKLLLTPPGRLVEEISPSRRYLEIAAWLKKKPDDWPKLEEVRKARIIQNDFPYLIPLIEAPREDPDQYAYVWSDEPCYGIRYGEFVQSRFFKLKDVYRAIVEDNSICCTKDVFVGAFESNVIAEQVTLHEHMGKQIEAVRKPMELKIEETPFSVCVAVCKEIDGGLRVVYVEGRRVKIDKAWVKGISKQLCSKSQVISSSKDLREDTKRDVLLKLRNAFEKTTLKIPNRYVKLFEELLDYSYKVPSSGYVYALALAIELATYHR